MPVGTDTTPTTEFEFTPEEQWAIHAAFLDYVEAAQRDDVDLPRPAVALTILEKVEDGDFAFTAFEADRVRHECEHHATSEYAPTRDREPARAVVEKIEAECTVGAGR